MQSSLCPHQPFQVRGSSDMSIPATQGSSETLWGVRALATAGSASTIAPSIDEAEAVPLCPPQKKRVTFGPDQVILITPRQTQSLLSCESIPTPVDLDEEPQVVLIPSPPPAWASQHIADLPPAHCGGEAVDVTPRYAQSPSTNAATALLSRSTNIFGAMQSPSSWSPVATSSALWASAAAEGQTWSAEDLEGTSASSLEPVTHIEALNDASTPPLIESMSSTSTFDAAASYALICGKHVVSASDQLRLNMDSSIVPLAPLVQEASPSTGDDHSFEETHCSAIGLKEHCSSDSLSIAAAVVDSHASEEAPLVNACEATLDDPTFATQPQISASMGSAVSSGSLVALKQLERTIPNHDEPVPATQHLDNYEQVLSFVSDHSASSASSSSVPVDDDFRTPPRGSNVTPSGLSTTRGLPLGPQCVFCSTSDALVMLHSGYYLHMACALWCPEVYCDPMSELLKHISDGVTRGAHLRCEHCNHLGATVGCLEDTCQRSYHYPCALAAGCALSPAPSPQHEDEASTHKSIFAPDEKFVMRCPLHSTPMRSTRKERSTRKRERD